MGLFISPHTHTFAKNIALRVSVSGQRLWDTTLRILDHWAFGEGSVRRLNQVSESPNALATAPSESCSWGLVAGGFKMRQERGENRCTRKFSEIGALL